MSRQAPGGLEEVPQETPTPDTRFPGLSPLKSSHWLAGGHSQFPTTPSRPPIVERGGESGARISLVASRGLLQAKCSYFCFG